MQIYSKREASPETEQFVQKLNAYHQNLKRVSTKQLKSLARDYQKDIDQFTSYRNVVLRVLEEREEHG